VREQTRAEQHECEWVLELTRDQPERSCPPGACEQVAAVALEPHRGLVRREPVVRGVECSDHLLDTERVPCASGLHDQAWPKRWRGYSIPRRSRAGHAVRIAVIKRWRNDMPDQTQEQNSSQPTSQGVSATTEGQPIEGQPTEGQPTEGQPEDATAALHRIGDTTADTIKKPTTLAAIAGGAVVASAVTFGVLETAVGGAAAYFAYRMLRRRRSEATAQGASRTG
jgi:hypothetical protein